MTRVTSRHLYGRRSEAAPCASARSRKTYKIAEFVEGDSPVPSMFESSSATVVSIDGPRIAALAQFLL